MRSSSRLFASVKSVSKFLDANTPTGLTGLSTHPSPRPALIYTYRKTLSQLTQLPPSSVYRQSAEAVTKHRLKIVEETVPEGFDAWAERVKKQIDASPKAYGKMIGPDGEFSYEGLGTEKAVYWDGEVDKKSAQQEGTNSMGEAETKGLTVQRDVQGVDTADREGVLPTIDDLEQEPPLTREQIHSVETKIAAGLIEEVVSVAEGELELVEQMLKHRPQVPNSKSLLSQTNLHRWDELEKPSPPGQWSYFERGDRV